MHNRFYKVMHKLMNKKMYKKDAYSEVFNAITTDKH